MINFRCKIGKSIQSGKKCIKLDEIEAEDLRKIHQSLDRMILVIQICSNRMCSNFIGLWCQFTVTGTCHRFLYCLRFSLSIGPNILSNWKFNAILVNWCLISWIYPALNWRFRPDNLNLFGINWPRYRLRRRKWVRCYGIS